MSFFCLQFLRFDVQVKSHDNAKATASISQWKMKPKIKIFLEISFYSSGKLIIRIATVQRRIWVTARRTAVNNFLRKFFSFFCVLFEQDCILSKVSVAFNTLCRNHCQERFRDFLVHLLCFDWNLRNRWL